MAKTLALVLALALSVAAQQTPPTTGPTPTIGNLPDQGASLPATCNVGQIFFKTTATIGLQQCTAANTWSAIGGGSITGGTCTNQAVTALSSGGVPTCTTVTSAYVDSTVAQTNSAQTFTSTIAEKGALTLNGSASSFVTLTPASNAANVVMSTGGSTSNGVEIGGVYAQVASNGFWAWGSATGLPVGADTALSRPAAKVVFVNDGGATTSRNGFILSGNTAFVTADFTTAANTSLQTITGLSWTVPATAINYSFTCDLIYSQATAAAAVAFGIQAATNAPTAINALGVEGTSLTASTSGTLRALASTTATNIVSATPSAAGAVGTAADMFTVHLAGTIENPAAANTFNIMTSTATSGDAVTVYRGSFCQITP